MPEMGNLGRLVASMSRSGGETAHFFVNVIGQAKHSYGKKHHSNPANNHKNP
ncbi:MAG TPA: hypothetical protein VFP59_07705 [Candidatus Angelobacter sp.]|nr:hypothetical protein [Candidatus Angelobacter sp.]